MVAPPSSSTTVWFWPSHTTQNGETINGHSALETCDSNGTRTYMSFCPESSPASKEDDDRRLEVDGTRTRRYILSSLNVHKINTAFQKFKENPNASVGWRGWGILQKRYAFSASGLTAFLLEQGGISKIYSYRRYDAVRKILQTVSISGFFFSACNWFSSYQFHLLFERDSRFHDYTLIYGLAAAEGHAANRSTVAIHQRALDFFMQTKDIPHRDIALKIDYAAETANKWLKKSLPPMPKKNVICIPSIRAAANEASEEFLFLAKVAGWAAVISGLFIIIHRRALQSDFGSLDEVERLVYKAWEIEQSFRE